MTTYLPGIARVAGHGGVAAGTFHGGYQLRWFSVAGTGFDSATLTDSYMNNFEAAVRAIESVATVVVLGTVGSSGFIVGIDSASYRGRGDNTGYAADGDGTTGSVAVLDTIVTNATKNINGNGSGGISTTVTELVLGSGSNGLAFG
jgi:hypothetical protein